MTRGLVVCVILTGCAEPGSNGAQTSQGTTEAGTASQETSGESAPGSSSSAEDTTSPSDATTETSASSGEPVDTSTTGADPLGHCRGYDDSDVVGDRWARVGTVADFCSVDPAPCGGDPTGDWALMKSCGYTLTPLEMPSICGEFSSSSKRIGTLSLADGTYELSTATTHSVTYGGETSCLGAGACEIVGPPSLEGAFGGGTAECASTGLFTCSCFVQDIIRDESMRAGLYFEGPSVISLDYVELMHCVDHDILDTWTPADEGTVLDVECSTDEECLRHLAATLALCVPP